jgi:hypothetical protein
MFTRQLLLVLAGGLLVPPVALPASPVRIEVTARLYNTAQLSAEITEAALSVASRALVAGAVDVAWRNCDSTDACGLVPGPRELVVRLVRSRAAIREAAPFVLGEASIDIGANRGVLATIYVDRVERMAALSETDAAVLLGRAIAHELGHLLLATNAHSAHGLMRARWTPGDLRRNENVDWLLTKKDAEAIKRRLQ